MTTVPVFLASRESHASAEFCSLQLAVQADVKHMHDEHEREHGCGPNGLTC